MLVDISKELEEHFELVKQHRDNTINNGEDKDIAAALRVCSDMIKDLIKMQAEVVNMNMINTLQQEVIAALLEVDHETADKVLKALERRLTKDESA